MKTRSSVFLSWKEYLFTTYSRTGFFKKLIFVGFSTFLLSFQSIAQVNHLVISQVYAQGGESGAAYNADYVELFNPTSGSITVAGWSIQTLTQNGWRKFNLPSFILPAGRYYLIQFAKGAHGSSLLLPDATCDLPLVPDGSVALVSTTTLLSGCTSAALVDLVGNGKSSCYESKALASFADVTKAAFRLNEGYIDTDNNAKDFALSTPNPRNTSYPSGTTEKIIPVKLLHFSVQEENKAAKIHWKVTEQVEVQQFEVEYSQDGKVFASKAVVLPQTSASVLDYEAKVSLENGLVHYFRLKVVNTSGTIDYSQVQKLKVMRQPVDLFSIQINPAKSHTVVSLKATGHPMRLELINNAGLVVWSKEAAPSSGLFKIEGLEQFTPGVYYLCVRDKSGTQAKLLIIK